MTKGDYICEHCGELFENKVQAVIHNMQTKHEDFELHETGVKLNINS